MAETPGAGFRSQTLSGSLHGIRLGLAICAGKCASVTKKENGQTVEIGAGFI